MCIDVDIMVMNRETGLSFIFSQRRMLLVGI